MRTGRWQYHHPWLMRKCIMNYNILSMAIIWQAAEDYREKKMFGLPTDEEEEFFKGDWCAYLLQNMNITGTDILKRLEEE